jgi:SPX domain protein involved in polyphosphate accumulation
MPDRTLASRYELKFWVPQHLVAEVRRHVRPFCRPDRYAEGRPGNRYTISSLYLDNGGFELYRTTTEGHHNRFKLRIRAYSDEADTPVFFEIKKRSNQVVRKRRAKVQRDVAARFLAGEPVSEASPVFQEFIGACRQLHAVPTLRVRYEREAYESRGGDPVRVTMDTRVMHSPTTTANLSLNGAGWEETPTEGTILEVKFTDNAPRWVAGMIRSLGIERHSIPKYVLSLDRAFSLHGRTPWAGSPAAGARWTN